MTGRYPCASLHLIEGPTSPVVTLAEAKAHLRVDHSDEDDLIEAIVAACTEHIDGRDGWIRRALMEQTWELRLSGFCEPVEIPLPPLIEIESIQYYDSDNNLQTASTDLYDVVQGAAIRAQVFLKANQSWPSLYDRAAAVIVRFRAGYVDATQSPPIAAVPAPIKAAIKLMAGTLYANRETVIVGQSVIEIPWAAEHLLRPYRVFA